MKRTIKILLGLVIIGSAILIINNVLTYVLVDNAGDEVKYTIDELYKQENIETLFLGSSHVLCGYDPRTLDEITGENTYLATTPVQKIDGSYYLLKEALKKNDIKKVYLDMYYRQYRDIPEERSDVQMEYIYCITDNMKNNWNRIEFLLNASGAERYLDGFLVPSRYGNYLLDLKRFERIVKSKRSDEYRNPTGPANYYKGTTIVPGTSGDPKMFGEIGQWNLSRIDDNIISEYSLEYLDKMVELCKKEDIELILTATPLSNFHLAAMEDYDVYYNYMKEYADKNGIEYYDFSLIKNSVLNLSDDCFLDTHHLSGKGALEYSKVFAEMMTNYEKAEREELFYDSTQEKLNDLPDVIFGIRALALDEEETAYVIEVVSNYQVNAEYKFIHLDAEGNELETLQEFDSNNVLDVSEHEFEFYKVIVKDKETGNICAEEQIEL